MTTLQGFAHNQNNGQFGNTFVIFPSVQECDYGINFYENGGCGNTVKSKYY